MSMNKFMVTGRLTADSELRFTQDGNTQKTGNWIDVEGHITIKVIPKEDGTKLRYTNLVAQSIFFGPNAYRNSAAQTTEMQVPNEDIAY